MMSRFFKFKPLLMHPFSHRCTGIVYIVNYNEISITKPHQSGLHGNFYEVNTGNNFGTIHIQTSKSI